MIANSDRRRFLKLTALAGSAMVFDACGARGEVNQNSSNAAAAKTDEPDKKDEKEEKEVTPNEDLMREHGILRRCLLVFGEAAIMLPSNPPLPWADTLQKTAKLFRAFGEEYHEKRLEEQYIFPLIKQKAPAGPAGIYPDILMAQHDRGRQITDYVISSTANGKVTNANELSRALGGFVRMYEAHAAREDTVVFPAWKSLLSSDEYDELGEKFEDIEQEQFGEDGFEDALNQIAAIEASIGMDDLSKYTPPAPPK
jgi:hemerythrin-like domain-containing protein